MVGIEVSHYDNVKVLGKGSFGQALLLQHKQVPSRRIVWKKPHSKRGGQRVDAVAECRREVQVMRSLKQDNIVRILDFSDATGDIFMEYCDCGDLRRITKERRKVGGVPLEESVVWKWTAQIAAALMYCHSQHILHRDMKAENILVHDGDVRVADFGLAKHLNSTTEFAETLLGTPLYLSPELCQASPYNSKVDMWGLGMVLHEMLTFESPFNADTFEDLKDRILHREIPDLSQRTSFSKPLTELCHALLAKNPKLRPSAGDVLCYCAQQHRVCLSYFDAGVLGFCGAVRKEREDSGWRKISVTAHAPDTVLLQMIHPGAIVNVREQPSMTAPILGHIGGGCFVEQVARVNIAGTTWIESFDGGFCVSRVPTTGESLFRAVPEFRVMRHSQAPSGSEGAAAATFGLREQQQQHSAGTRPSQSATNEPNPPHVDSANNKRAGSLSHVAEKAASEARAAVGPVLDRFYVALRRARADDFSSSGCGDAARVVSAREELVAFLEKHMTQQRIQDHVAKYPDMLRNNYCDMLWTLGLCHELRAEGKVFCAPVLRALAVSSASASASSHASTRSERKKTTANNSG